MTPIDIPIGRVEFLGQVLHIVEHEGRLLAACNDEHGVPFEALASGRLDGHGCRDLMREAIDLLIDAADFSLTLSAFAANRPPAARRTRRPRVGGDTSKDNARCSKGATPPLNLLRPEP